MTDLTLEALRAELAPIQAKLDGLAVINRALTVLQQDMRALRAAFNDQAAAAWEWPRRSTIV